MADLRVKIGKMEMKNPVTTASGTFGYGKEYSEYFPLERLGAVTVKGITLEPVHGNPQPRTAEVTSGLLNAIGLQGPGVEKFLKGHDYLPFLKTVNVPVIVNIWGRTVEEYALTAEKLRAAGDAISALEINVSCPNVKEGGIAFGTDTKQMMRVLSAVKKVTDKNMTLIAKLSPNVTRIQDFAEAAEDCGMDALSLINTVPAMAINIETFRPRLANNTGGLSGPAIKPIAVRMVYEASKAVNIPVIGMGGICSWEDAAEFILAGASAVAVGTAIFADPFAPVNVIDGLSAWLDRKGFKSVADAVGKADVFVKRNI